MITPDTAKRSDLPAAWGARDLPRGPPGDLEEPDHDRSASGRFRAQPTRQSNLLYLFLAVEAWVERRQRRALLALNDHALKDFGLSSADAWQEGNKAKGPFSEGR